MLPLLTRSNRGVQVNLLWNMIQQYNVQAKVPERLDNLTEEMIKGKANHPNRGAGLHK